MYNFKPLGEMAIRAAKNYGRLHDGIYHCWKVPHCDLNWPGDYEGRALLGLISQAQVNDIEPVYLKEMTECMFERSKEFGYFGDEFNPERVNEQQLSGNSWFLRSMVELYRYNGDERALDRVRRCMKNLFIPCIGLYDQYPLERTTSKAGKESGEVDALNGCWLCSTDIGCAYIPLDGVSSGYELLKSLGDDCTDIVKLLKEMVRNYFKLDFIGMKVQTHATLSGLRGIMRYAKVKGIASYFKKVKTVFGLYLAEGMTENFENKNWFRRPEWTEPCAIIDSFAVAYQLYEYYGNPYYMNIALKIYYNGLCTSQRYTGGFGTDKCVGFDALDTISIGCKEATWCCTMRGGEGFKYVISAAVVSKDDAVYVNIPESGRYESEHGYFEIKSDYPCDGKIEVHAENFDLPIKIFIPDYVKRVTVDGVRCSVQNGYITIEGHGLIEFEVPFFLSENVYMHGNLVLCSTDKIKGVYHPLDKARGIYTNGVGTLFPIKDAFFPWEDLDGRIYYVMKGLV